MTRYSILFLALALLCSACGKQKAARLSTVTVERGQMTETVTATGTVESVTSVDVGTQVTGIIEKLYADYNSVVKKGELIAELEKTVLQSEVSSALSNVKSAKATYDYTLTNFRRDKQLHDKQLISDLEYQTSQKDLEVARMSYEKAVADKVRADKNLNYAEIYSPIDGIVISRDVEVGQTVVSNMSVANLYTIADLDHMQVIGNVDEADIGNVKTGQRVTFSVDAFPDDTFEGVVTQVRLSPTTESNVVTYEVVVAANNPDHKLIPGLTANLTIYVTEQNNVLTLPVQALNFTPRQPEEGSGMPAVKGTAPQKLADNEKVVWVLADNALSPRTVKIGDNNGVKAAIISGLKEGDVVALDYDDSAPEIPDAAQDNQSPFAPQPPGRNKNKQQQPPA